MTGESGGGDNVERRIHEASRLREWIIPQTPDDVRRAEDSDADSDVTLPEAIRDPNAVLARFGYGADDQQAHVDEGRVFGVFVQMMRRRQRLTIDQLAKKARVEAEEIREIESNPKYEPKPRTIHQLASVFSVPPAPLVRLSNASRRTIADPRLENAVVRFAAHATDVPKLTREEKQALDEFVRLLSSLD